MDWKTISNNLLLVGLFVAMVTMFNQVNGRLETPCRRRRIGASTPCKRR